MHILPCKLHQFGLDPFLLQLLEYLPDEDGRVPVTSGASVECYDFHGLRMYSWVIKFLWSRLSS